MDHTLQNGMDDTRQQDTDTLHTSYVYLTYIAHAL